MLKIIDGLLSLKYLPDLSDKAGLGLLFIFGVLTSFHCIAMCGSIAISQCIGKNGSDIEGHNEKPYLWTLPSLLYNTGRILSYTAFGAVAGGVGCVISFPETFKGVVPLICGVFLIIMGLNLLGVFRVLRRFNISMPYFFVETISRRKKNNPLFIGLLTVLMPCAPLQIVQLYALGTKSIIYGALSMFAFAVGTVPIIFILGAVSTAVNKKHSRLLFKASAIIVLVLGFAMISRGTAFSGISLNIHSQPGWQNVAQIHDGIQTVATELQPNSYPVLVVQKGIPVRWTMKVDRDNLNNCNSAIIIPKLNIERSFLPGDNVIEFTPIESGELVYTCWMGMIKSRIMVVDNLR